MIEIKSGTYESKDRMVSHPDHYLGPNGMEVIDVIETFTEGLEGVEATDTGNIIKYICRWKKKGGVQDLEKILWYTTHLIGVVKRKQEEASCSAGMKKLADRSKEIFEHDYEKYNGGKINYEF